MELGYSSDFKCMKLLSHPRQLHIKKHLGNIMDWKKQSTLKIICVQMVFVRVLEALVNLEGFKFRFSLHAEFVWGLASGFTQILFCVIFFLPEGRMQVVKKLIAYTKHSQKEKIILCGNGCPVQVQVVRSLALQGALHVSLQTARAQICKCS